VCDGELIARLREEVDEHARPVRVRAWTNAYALTRVCAHRDAYICALGGTRETFARPNNALKRRPAAVALPVTIARALHVVHIIRRPCRTPRVLLRVTGGEGGVRCFEFSRRSVVITVLSV